MQAETSSSKRKKLGTSPTLAQGFVLLVMSAGPTLPQAAAGVLAKAELKLGQTALLGQQWWRQFGSQPGGAAATPARRVAPAHGFITRQHPLTRRVPSPRPSHDDLLQFGETFAEAAPCHCC